MTQLSQLRCPACNESLTQEGSAGGRITIWCGYGPCVSYAANDGHSGQSEPEAYEKLCRAVKREKESK